MADKATIGGKIVLEGEAEYRNALKNINQAQRELRSEMKLSAQSFSDSQNSIDALKQKYEILTKQYDKQQEKVELYTKALDRAKEKEDNAAKKVADLKEELAEAERKMSDMSDTSDTTSEALEDQQKAIDDLKSKLKLAEEGYDKAARTTSDYQTKVNDAKTELGKLNDALDETGGYLEEAEHSTDQCAKSIDQYGKKTKEAAEEQDNFKEKAKEAVNQLATALAASGIEAEFDKIKDSLMECVEAAGKFETAIAKVSTIADTSKVSLNTMKGDILDTSSTLGVAATDIADVAYNAISAGVDSAKAVGVAGEATKLAKAGFTESSAALSVLTTTMNSYKMSADDVSKISDSLVATQNKGVLTINELASSMGKGIASASAYSVDLYNLESGYISLTKSGIATAEATTYMSSMFSELGKSSSNVGKVIQEKTGKSFGQLMKSGKSLGDVLEILYKNCGKDSEALMQLWGSQEAGKAASAIINQGLDDFNQNLVDLQNSTGLAQEAFETMADTSEETQARMETSFENLKISIGDALRPSIDDLYESATDMTGAFTDFVRENPEVVQAIATLLASLGTMAGVVATASGAMLAFNALMLANPYVIAAGAIAGVAVALGKFVTAADKVKDADDIVKEQNKQLKESFKDLKKGIEDSAKSREDANKAQDIQAQTVKKLSDQLVELQKKENLSNTEQARAKQLVDELNTAMPELNLELDEQGKLVGMTADELQRYCDMSLQAIEIQLKQGQLTEIAEQHLEAENKLNEALENQKVALDNLNEAYNKYNDSKNNQTTIDPFTDLQGLKDAYAESTAIVQEYQQAVDELETEYSNLTGEIQTASDTLAAQKDTWKDSEDATIEYRDKVYEVSQDVVEDISEIKGAYDTALTAAQDSLKSQVGLFQKLSVQSDLTAEQMANNLHSQTDTYNQYSEDIRSAMKLMKDDTTGNVSEMVQSIMDMGINGAGYLHELVTAAESSTGAFEEVMEEFAQMQTAREGLAETMADLQTGYTTEMDKLLGLQEDYNDQIATAQEDANKDTQIALEDALETIADTTESGIETMATVIKEKTPEVTKSAEDLCTATDTSIRKKLEVDEDGKSQLFRRVGWTITNGVAQGIYDGQETVSKALQDVVDKAIDDLDLSELGRKIDKALGDAFN